MTASKSVAPARKLINPAHYFSFSDHYFRDISANSGIEWGRARGGMAGKTVVVRLNQQQLELLDRTIAGGEATTGSR